MDGLPARAIACGAATDRRPGVRALCDTLAPALLWIHAVSKADFDLVLSRGPSGGGRALPCPGVPGRIPGSRGVRRALQRGDSEPSLPVVPLAPAPVAGPPGIRRCRRARRRRSLRRSRRRRDLGARLRKPLRIRSDHVSPPNAGLLARRQAMVLVRHVGLAMGGAGRRDPGGSFLVAGTGADRPSLRRRRRRGIQRLRLQGVPLSAGCDSLSRDRHGLRMFPFARERTALAPLDRRVGGGPCRGVERRKDRFADARPVDGRLRRRAPAPPPASARRGRRAGMGLRRPVDPREPRRDSRPSAPPAVGTRATGPAGSGRRVLLRARSLEIGPRRLARGRISGCRPIRRLPKTGHGLRARRSR